MNFRRVMTLAVKEIQEITRDRLLFSLAFVVPPIIMLVIGFGVSTDVRDIPFVILDYDRTEMSREFAHKFKDSRYFGFKGYVRHERDIRNLITDNKARAAIVIPSRFHERLRSGRPAKVQTIIDGSIPSQAETVSGYVSSVIAHFSSQRLAQYVSDERGLSNAAATGMIFPISLHTRFLYNEAMTSRWAIGPGAVMTVLAFVPPILASVGVVREKESGSIDNVYSSTLRRDEFVLGKLIPYVLLASINFFVLWSLALIVFHVPFRGSPWLFALIGILYVTCTTMMGMFISFFVNSQIASVLLTVIVTLIPTLQYSGMIVPLSSLSESGRLQARMLPASYFYEAVQASFLKGVGIEAIWHVLVALSLYVSVLYLFCCLKFSKRPTA